MEKLSTIYHRAAERHGGEDTLEAKLSAPNYHDFDTAPKSDDRWLSEFTKRIFQAGFNWKVIDNKWDGIETAFWGFKISRCARLDMDDMEAISLIDYVAEN